MNNKFKVNLDKLELCYTTTRGNAEELINTKYREDNSLKIYSTDKGEVGLKSYFVIEVKEKSEDGSLYWRRFAELSIGSSFETLEAPTRYVWISVFNEVLYSPIYPNVSIVGYIWDIAEALGLQFHNFTKLEIAIDTNTNYFSRAKRAIRSEAYTPIVLGRAYKERKEIIESLIYIHTGDRERYRTGTLSVKDKERTFELSIYDKSREILESGKEYIAEWDSFKQIYRLEVRLNNRAIKEYSTQKEKSLESLYFGLLDRELLFDMFLYFSDRALRFRKGRDSYSVIQL